MFTKDYAWYLKHLMEHVDLNPRNVLFVENIGTWCREHGIDEADAQRPFRLIAGNGGGARMLVAEQVDDDVIGSRITALSLRGQIKSVANDRSELLNSNYRKLAYLFLKEIADTNPSLQNDELADEWIFDQLNRIGALWP
jgi:hypothetical protein